MQLRGIGPGLIEHFAGCKEDGLPDTGGLDEPGLGGGSVVFMLPGKRTGIGSGIGAGRPGALQVRRYAEGTEMAAYD
jgi:hypothetical protein